MNKDKKTAIIWFIAAFFAYIASILFRFSASPSIANLWLCLGSAWAIFALLSLGRSRNRDDDDGEI